MVRLFNIAVNGTEISCDYEPEGSNKIGRVTVDTTSYEVKKINFSNYEYGKNLYVSHVRSTLETLLKSGEPLPEETTSVWH